MTDEQKKQIVLGQLHAFTQHDEEAFLKHIADSYKSIDIPSGESLTGKEGAREFFRRWSNAFPDGKTTAHVVLVSGDQVTVTFTGEGTQKGNLGPFPPSNKRASLEFAQLHRVDAQGKVIETTTYYDQLSLLLQLGHIQLPTPVGAAR
jgi:steroid delta-isomerase-like uncharacterized protein